MIILIEGTSNKLINDKWGQLNKGLKNATTLVGGSDWTYLDWINKFQEYDNKENILLVIDSWLTHRAKARLENEKVLISDTECQILADLVRQSKGYLEFITRTKDEDVISDICKDYGCLEDYARKIFNEITYEVLQSKILMLVNVTKSE